MMLFDKELARKDELPTRLFRAIAPLFCGILEACDYTGVADYQYQLFLRTVTASFHLIFWEFSEFMTNFFAMPQEEAYKWQT